MYNSLLSEEYYQKTSNSRKIEKYISDGEYEALFSLFKYKNVSLFHNGILITEDKYNILDANNYYFEKNLYDIIKNPIIPLIELNDSEYISLIGPWSHNYWHWVFNYLPLVIIAETFGFKGKYIVKNDFFIIQKLSTLFLLGIESKRIINQREETSFFVSNLVSVEPVTHEDERILILLKIIRHKILNFLSKPKIKTRKIYISRDLIKGYDKKANNGRYIINEEEVWQLLNSYGFERFFMEKIPIEKQLEFVSEANFIIGAHGAGITHSLFMQEKSNLIEFFSPTYVHYCSSLLPTKILKHNYKMVISEISEKYTYGESHEAPIYVPIDYLEMLLNNLLSKDE
ncbi:MAG: glycosyltransferase family 61 protein [Candidatus Sericytochromatia bacterium]